MKEDTWVLQTTNGIFLGVRYSEEAAQYAKQAYDQMWTQGVVIVKQVSMDKK